MSVQALKKTEKTGRAHADEVRSMKALLPRRPLHYLILFLLPASVLFLTLSACRERGSSPTQAIFPKIALTLTATGFTQPLGIVNAGDGSGRLFIVEQGGSVKIIKNGAVLATPFLDIAPLLKSSAGEQGLLSIAFPPGYGVTKQHLYTNYTGTRGVGDTVIARFQTTLDPDVADPLSGQTLLTVVQPFANHNGGQLAFGPDGYLYIGLGDGGSGGDPFNNAQNPLSLLGKVLRIDVESGSGGYSIPPTNPFAINAAYLPEIWALGLRNPWRFSFDRETGDLFIGDVGQNLYEEVDVQSATSAGGENYGWNTMEGLHCYNAVTCDQTGLTPPVAEYDHSQGECSITGGFVYRGAEYPALQGVYLFDDYCSGRIWGMRSGTVVQTSLLLESGLLISAFGEDEAGNLYVADHRSGSIYRVVVP
jgi:glucose/arabinose dehydrogenase